MWDGKFMYGTDRMVIFDTPLMTDMSMSNKIRCVEIYLLAYLLNLDSIMYVLASCLFPYSESLEKP